MSNQNLEIGAKLPFLDVKASGQGQLSGYGSVFSVPDMHGDIVRPGAFTASLQKRNPALLWSHDMSAPIGRWTEAKEDGHGLRLMGQLNLNTEAGSTAHAHLRAGDVDGLSIGFAVPQGGAKFVDGVRNITAIELFEVSVVAIPSNEAARVTETRTINGPADLEQSLSELGIPRRAAQTFARGGWSQFTGIPLEEIEARLEAQAQADADQQTIATLAREFRAVAEQL